MLSCTGATAQENKNIKSVEEIISKLNPLDTINLLDLSYKNIIELPDLSKFKVRKLDISHNNLDTLILKNLPKYLVNLDVSHNKLKKEYLFISPKSGCLDYIKQINLSNNEIEVIGFSFLRFIERINVSNNKLHTIGLSDEKLKYLDISNNKKLSNIVNFFPTDIDTIIRDHIANDAPLITNPKHHRSLKNYFRTYPAE
ncbi:hypothetical protein QVZ41_13150 [Wenyingzhuangia sp. chi5]|uniref:Leucine-rich repeat domain-containing protein n=1 Tax=Wenyingzhuangia gilva TaxID=3057677 RepID=A0ABT8VUZ2_9FLAO|nr:hypothetical protein [Wenyingzhuangia sp. chi5]MDO3695790.1 hypothetical protein [Wenyingzhuangia sp. chi5]